MSTQNTQGKQRLEHDRFSPVGAALGESAAKVVTQVAAILSGLSKAVSNFVAGVLEFGGEVVGVWTAHQRMVEAGWMPSFTAPYRALAEKIFEPGFCVDAYLLEFYGNNWPVLEAKFRRRLAAYSTDAESIKAIGEAISAHG